MASKFRAPGAPLPYIHGVDPSGAIRQLPFARNINNGMTEMVGREIQLTRSAEAEGWIRLSDAYANDPSAKKKSLGYKTYCEWERAAIEKRAPRIRVQKGDGSQRPATDAFPRSLLPAEVLARRDGTSSVSTQVWEAPSLDDDVTTEIEIPADKPKSKRGKSKAEA